MLPQSPTRGQKEFHSEPSRQATLYYANATTNVASPTFSERVSKEADEKRREQRLQRDLQETQQKILTNYTQHHAQQHQQETKENGPTSPVAGRARVRGGDATAFSAPLASDYSDLAPDSLAYRAPRGHGDSGSPSRGIKHSRCIIAGCSFEPVGGRGFCAVHSQAADAAPVRVITKGSQGFGGQEHRRAHSPSKIAPSGHFLTGGLGNTVPSPSVASAAMGVHSTIFPAILPNVPHAGSTAGQSHSRTQIIQQQHRDSSSSTASAGEVSDVSSFLSNIGTSGSPASPVQGTPFKLSSSRMSGPMVQYSTEESIGGATGGKILTPRTASAGGTLHPTPPSAQPLSHTSSSGSPAPVQRALRTPAGLALSYEHGRNIKGLRKEVLYKGSASRGSGGSGNVESDGNTTGLSNSLLPGPPLISHVHQTPLQPLSSTSGITIPSQTGLTHTLNRVASPPAGAQGQRGFQGTLTPLPGSVSSSVQGTPSSGPAVALRVGSPGEVTATGQSPSPKSGGPAGKDVPALTLHQTPITHQPPTHTQVPQQQQDKPLTAVQRQRAYRAALLSKALAKPSSVQSLDRQRLDTLKNLLGKRSSLFQLLKRKVLLAPEDAAKEREAKLASKSTLSNLLSARPSAAALTNKNILRDESSLTKAKETRGALGNFFAKRPSVMEVQKQLSDPKAKQGLLGQLGTSLEEKEEGEEEEDHPKPSTESTNKDEESKDADEGGDSISETLRGPSRTGAGGKRLGPAADIPVRRTSVVLPPGRRKFSVFTSVKMATSAEKTLNKLSSFLENRPHFEELMKKNIMMTKPGSSFHSNPKLAENARKMSFSNLRNNVSRLLQTRPTMKDLKSMAKSLLGSMVKGQMDAIRENESDAAAADAAAAAHAQAEQDGKSGDASSGGTGEQTTAAPGISLESLASGNLKIDEILSQKRRVLDMKLRARAKEEEESGGIYLMGSNERGQAGVNVPNGQQDFVVSFTHLRPLLRETIVQVACGWEHSLCRTVTGFVFSWGANSYGQCGLSDTADRDQPYSIQYRGSPLFKKIATFIAACEKCSAVCTKDGEVYTFGSVQSGALGHGNPDNDDPNVAPIFCSTPTSVPELRGKNIQKFSLGASHGAAVDKQGRMYTWGRNSTGALGNNDTVDRFKPSLIENHGEFWSEVSCGAEHTGAIGFDNNVYTWGSNRNGQLGYQSSSGAWNDSQLAPKVVMSLFRKGVHKISCSRHHTVALTEDGEAWTTIIIDHPKFIEKCKFHRMKPNLHLKDVVATPIDNTMAIDLQGNMYTWEPNALDDPKVDDTLETRHLSDISAGLEFTAVLGTINKRWRTDAIEASKAAAAAAQ